MNRLYSTSFALLTLSTTVFAQAPSRAIKQHFERISSEYTLPNRGADRVTIWEDDFSDPTNWTIGNINDPSNDNWVIGTGVPSGEFPIAGIASTTAANGFALFDSDLLCGGTQNAYVQMAEPTDISAYSGAVLQFEQFYRDFQGQTFVDVSNNGNDWTEFEVNADLAVNASTPNPQLISLNITSVAGNQPTVWVRFRYVGSCDYAWMVDDASIIELPVNDLIMNSAFLSHTGGAEEYCRIPTGQLLSTMLVGGNFENFGSAQQTNVVVNMEVRNAADVVVFSASTTPASLDGSTTGEMSQEVALPTLPLGIYTATFTVSSDQSGDDATPDNNSYKRSFEINDDIFSMDGIGNHPPGLETLTSLGTASFDGGEDGFVLMTQYNITNSLMVYGIEFDITSTSMAGAGVTVALRDTADVLAETPNMTNLLAESDLYSLTASDITAGIVRQLFVAPIELPVGGYYAGVEMFSNAGVSDIAVLDDITVPEPELATVIFILGDDVFTNGNAAAVRLITDPNISVREMDELAGVTLFPNPSNGLVRINTTVFDAYTVEVMNMLGETVKTTRINGSSVLDLSTQAKGVYMVRIANEKAATTQRITLN